MSKMLGFVLAAILVPLLAALLPIYIHASNRTLEYEVTSLVSVRRGIDAFSMEISNRGREVERSVKIWIKSYRISSNSTDASKEISANSSVPLEMVREDDYDVITIGDIRPNEKIQVNALLLNRSFHHVDPIYDINVKSADVIGQSSQQIPSQLRALSFSIWMNLSFLAGLLAGTLASKSDKLVKWYKQAIVGNKAQT